MEKEGDDECRESEAGPGGPEVVVEEGDRKKCQRERVRHRFDRKSRSCESMQTPTEDETADDTYFREDEEKNVVRWNRNGQRPGDAFADECNAHRSRSDP